MKDIYAKFAVIGPLAVMFVELVFIFVAWGPWSESIGLSAQSRFMITVLFPFALLISGIISWLILGPEIWNSKNDSHWKTTQITILVFLGPFGPLLYWFFGRKQLKA